ncbi:hypothetical protein QFZ70_002869 [Arthrobacter sp. V1I9]|uniref:hypothetical protein n=1 Tax=Arthrobacter sp. V1I9 TaxID=3042275 RepID=UPI002792535E|nr:hypothetical protein [Arthrobacter sp. V1I9]MDQ0870396.1 hypothetical protein [Arthrobacter sp. V1I9]
MTAQFPVRIRAWFADTFSCETPGQAADAMADATRWGWLPALSGVAVGADHAREQQPESTA